MLYPTAGSRLYIADAPALEWGPFPAAGWVEIGETEAIGLLGSEFDLVDATYLRSDGYAGEMVMKGVERRPEMPVIMGNDPEDPGQLLLLKALRSSESFPFRLVLPDGVTMRHWFALVFRLGEVFDTANSVMKLQVDLKPTSAIERG